MIVNGIKEAIAISAALKGGDTAPSRVAW